MRKRIACQTVALVLLCAGCKTVPTASGPPAVAPPVVQKIAWEQKVAWMLRLEDQRLVRDPNPPAPAVLRPATAREPAIVAAPAPSDLLQLLADEEARTRRRAALALGRVGLAE